MPKDKRDWKKIVSESEGQRIFLPDGFKKAQEELDAMRRKYNEDAVKMAEREIKMNVANNDLFLELRTWLAKNGHADIWVKSVGFDAEALKEGIFIVNIADNG